MSKKFIEKAHGIVMSNLSEENFGASSLASMLGLSTSQTLRRIKAATGKSANIYIRDIRLKEAARLIQETELSFAEISYQVGFNSASYFSKTFSKYYGITPGEFKIRKLSSEELDTIKPKQTLRSFITSKSTLYIGIVFLALLVGYFIVNDIAAKNNSLPNSIAVLPFKDLSQQDNQWFCDGVSENILHSLAQIKDVTVTSFTSSSTYRNSEKRIPEIAKELGVSYILEGSVVLHDNKTKIIVQLIDRNDNYIWSKEYSDDFNNIIDIQNNVAQEVLSQFKTILTPIEEQTLNAYPTKNMEAYALHLEGSLINESRKFEDLEKNIENNKKAIALDSNFVEAYA
ncbi:helix-turn-helix domain-containing protein [Aequorivita capsosiphonis]|uniref:helix-turn-helix domain-containing protein n=1 Tax=Aequorivita capsosiphonis TaxID=487317 RepID=UPI0012FA119E|nr:helix-turn-helix domain-containing protein [Aequorivita capsosiphonis]